MASTKLKRVVRHLQSLTDVNYAQLRRDVQEIFNHHPDITRQRTDDLKHTVYRLWTERFEVVDDGDRSSDHREPQQQRT